VEVREPCEQLHRFPFVLPQPIPRLLLVLTNLFRPGDAKVALMFVAMSCAPLGLRQGLEEPAIWLNFDELGPAKLNAFLADKYACTHKVHLGFETPGRVSTAHVT
jgi:hypothetical protein